MMLPDPKLYATVDEFYGALVRLMRNNNIYDPSKSASVAGSSIVDSSGVIVNDDMLLNGRATSSGNMLPDWNFQLSRASGFAIAKATPAEYVSQDRSKYFANANSTTASFGLTGENSTAALRFQDAGNHIAISTYVIDVNPGQLLRVSVKAKRNATWTNGLLIRAYEFDASNAYLATAPVSTVLLYLNTSAFEVSHGTLQLGASTNRILLAVQLSGASQPAGAIIDINWVWVGVADFAATAGAGTLGETLITNPGFELGHKGWLAGGGGSGRITYDLTNSRNGSYVCSFGANASTDRYFNEVLYYPISPGDLITYGAYTKSSASFTGTVGILVDFYTSAKAAMGNDAVAQSSANTTWAMQKKTTVAPANSAFIGISVYTNSVTLGTGYIDDCFAFAQSGATIGESIYSDGVLAILGEMDLRNDLVCTVGVSSETYNPSMRFARRNPANALAPAGYFRYNSSDNIVYESDTTRDALKAPASGAVICSSAFKVQTPFTYTATLVLKDIVGASSTCDVYVEEYDSVIPESKYAIGGATTQETEVQTRTRQITLATNITLGTAYTSFEYTYTPTSTCKWASISFDDNSRSVVAKQISVAPSSNNNDLSNSAVVSVSGGSYSWTTDAAGAWPAGNPTHDITITFYRSGTSIATHVVRGTLTTATGVIAVASQSTTGETTTYSETGDGTSYAVGTAKHTASNQGGGAIFQAINIAIGGNLGK